MLGGEGAAAATGRFPGLRVQEFRRALGTAQSVDGGLAFVVAQLQQVINRPVVRRQIEKNESDRDALDGEVIAFALRYAVEQVGQQDEDDRIPIPIVDQAEVENSGHRKQSHGGNGDPIKETISPGVSSSPGLGVNSTSAPKPARSAREKDTRYIMRLSSRIIQAIGITA